MKKTIFLLVVFSMSVYLFAYPGAVVKSIPSPGKFSSGLTFDGKYLWVSDYKDDQIYQIDPENGKVVHQIKSPGFWPADLAWDGTHLWNVDIGQDRIFKIDPEDGTVLEVLDSPTSDPQGLTWDGNKLWVGDGKSNRLMSIDMSDGTAVKRYRGPARRINGLTFDGQYLWSSDRLMDELYMINPSNGEIIIILDSPGPYPRGLAFDGKFLWCQDSEKDIIYKLVRKDKQNYVLRNKRHALVTSTHQVHAYGSGILKNLNVYFAIPENLPQQKILDMKFYPDNYQSEEDRWGQKVVHYNFKGLKANVDVETKAVFETEISDIDYFIFPDEIGSLKDIPREIRKKYTADGSKYLLNDPYIQETSEKIVGDEKHPYWMARKIFDFVGNQLEYKLEGGWNAAPVVLQRGTGSCSEYSFSFIALCRAAGIPARYVGSYVVRGDDASLDDVYHRWPEIYLPGYGWIPIDPQGGDRPIPRDRAMHIGHLSNRFLITTQGGGDSEFLGWYYNTNENYTCDPGLKIEVENFAEWEPITTDSEK